MTASRLDPKRATLRQHSIDGMAAIAAIYSDTASEWCPHRPPLKVTRTWQIPVFFGPDSLLEAS
jgi:hypothetical protein